MKQSKKENPTRAEPKSNERIIGLYNDRSLVQRTSAHVLTIYIPMQSVVVP